MSLSTRRRSRSLVGAAVTMATVLSLYGAAAGPAAAVSGPSASATRVASVRRAIPPGQKAAHFAPPALARGRVTAPLTKPIRAVSKAQVKPGAAVFRADVRPTKPSAPKAASAATATPADDGGNACDSAIGAPDSTTDLDQYLEQTVSVGFSSDLSCIGIVDFAAEALLIDRSPDFNGQSFDGDDISDGDVIGQNGTSTGSFQGDTRTYDGARSVESAVALDAILTYGSVWGGCAAGPGVEILICDGIGTDELFSVYGAGGQETGMAPACRDFAVTGDTEHARMNTLDGTTMIPYSTEILGAIPQLEDDLVAFRQNLCGQTGPAGDFARKRGLGLWNDAVDAAHTGEAGGDDRPLHWARLGMILTLDQWIPTGFTPDTTAATTQLEPASRGMLSANFTSSAPRVLISGFDPFGLDPICGGSNDQGLNPVLNANVSAQAVLRLDGDASLTGPGGTAAAEVHAVVLPVEYSAFDRGLIEDFFAPYPGPGSGQLVNIVNTVSDGGDPTLFTLEFYNGRNRSTGTGFGDNECATAGNPNNPTTPAGLGGLPQFTESTLPVDAISNANPALAATNYQVTEIRNTAQGPSPAVSANGPHVASTAVAGGGGGFLSNEIAYRVTEVRDELGSPALVGHIHTPRRTNVDPTVAQAYENLPASAVQAAPPVRVTVTTDKALYNVGDAPVYTVEGPPNTEALWSSSLNGIETGEIDVDYGQRTDGNGGFTVAGGTWTSVDIGTWIKQVRFGNVIATVSFTIQNPPQ